MTTKNNKKIRFGLTLAVVALLHTLISKNLFSENQYDYIYYPYENKSYNPADYAKARGNLLGGDYPANYKAANTFNNGTNLLSYHFLDVFYERTFYDEQKNLENSNGFGVKMLASLAKGFFLDLGASYTNINKTQENNADASTTDASTTDASTTDASTTDASTTDASTKYFNANLGLGVYFPLVDSNDRDRIHLIGKGGFYYSNYDFDVEDVSDMLNGLGWYIGPELRILATKWLELGLDATYIRIEKEAQLNIGAQATFYINHRLGLGLKFKILEDDSLAGIGLRFSWD